MTQDKPYRSAGLAVLVVVAAVVGSVAAAGTVAAQDASENGTNASASEENFYSPSDDEPLNVRFRDAAANTVESVAEGVLNLNIVYGLFDEPYDVEITAPGLSDEQVDGITFDSEQYDTEGLDRTEIVGMNFTGVPAGDYEFTVSVVDGDAERTVPLEVTGEEGEMNNATADAAENESAANETTAANESADNETTDATTTANATTTADAATETEMGMDNETATGEGNATITAAPSAPNTSANYTVSTVVGADAAGNLSELTINYGESNASIGLVGGSIFAASLGGESVVNNTTAPTLGAEGRNLTIGFDGTVEATEGDRLNVTYGGVTNPPENGSYPVGVAVNNGSFQNATLAIGERATTTNATAGDTTTGNETGAATDGNASITAMPTAAGASANYTVTIPVDEGSAGNLSAVAVNYTGSNATVSVGPGMIYTAEVAGENVSANVTSAGLGAVGETALISFDGTPTVEAGDVVTLTFGGITNPTEAGSYDVGLDVNPENGSGTNASLSITEATETTGTAATATTAGGETTTGGEATGDGETAAETAAGTTGEGGQGTEAGGPGFGVAVAVVALLGAALLAARRS